jgi:predicted nucleic acid-binding protein
MKVLRIYVDTSVIGGVFDVEFAEWSKGLVEDFRGGAFRPVFSDVTAAEVEKAPDQVRTLFAELVPLADWVEVSSETLDLVKRYEAHRILGPRYRNDMLHVALATVADVDVVVSWNFKHVVRLDKIRLFNAVNIETGYKPLVIYSPREVTTHGREADGPRR